MKKTHLIWTSCIRTKLCKQHLQGSSSQSLKLVLQNSRCMSIPFSPVLNWSALSRFTPLRKDWWVRLEATQSLKYKYMSSSLPASLLFLALATLFFHGSHSTKQYSLTHLACLKHKFFFAAIVINSWKNYQLIMKASVVAKISLQ